MEVRFGQFVRFKTNSSDKVIKMKRTHISHVGGVDVRAGAVGAGLSLLQVISTCIQSLVQLPQTGLQLTRLTCTQRIQQSGNMKV